MVPDPVLSQMATSNVKEVQMDTPPISPQNSVAELEGSENPATWLKVRGTWLCGVESIFIQICRILLQKLKLNLSGLQGKAYWSPYLIDHHSFLIGWPLLLFIFTVLWDSCTLPGTGCVTVKVKCQWQGMWHASAFSHLLVSSECWVLRGGNISSSQKGSEKGLPVCFQFLACING